jgi:hypothetical protein
VKFLKSWQGILPSILFFAAWLLLGSLTGRAGENDWRRPLANRNQFPLALLFIAPNRADGEVLPRGARSVSLNFDYSNILSRDAAGRESLWLDMEYTSAAIGFQVGLGRGFEAGASLPIYAMHGGFLDPLISGLHDTFGYPNEFRSSIPDNLFQYYYRLEGEPLLARATGTTGAGDLTLTVRKALEGRYPLGIRLVAHAAAKLPTGSRDRLSGSGGYDYGFGINARRVGRSVGGYLNFSYNLPGDSDGLKTRNFAALAAAFDWRFRASWPNLALVVQFEQFQRFLKSDLPVLNQSPRQMVLGLRWRRSDRFCYEWRLAEDLDAATPDFTFGFLVSVNWPEASAK